MFFQYSAFAIIAIPATTQKSLPSTVLFLSLLHTSFTADEPQQLLLQSGLVSLVNFRVGNYNSWLPSLVPWNKKHNSRTTDSTFINKLNIVILFIALDIFLQKK